MTENLRDLYLTLPIIPLGRNGLNILIKNVETDRLNPRPNCMLSTGDPL